MKKILLGVKTRLLNFLYNEDRSISRPESNPIDEEAADVLDAIQKNHVENAVLHADKLDAADNGQEQ